MLRFPLFAAVAALSVMPATSALAHDGKKLHVHNNTSYDFTDGYVSSQHHVTITNLPESIPAGDSREIDVQVEHSSWKADIHWIINSQVGTTVAIKYELDGNYETPTCHTDVPEGIHSDHYNCNSENVKFYFCDSSSKSECDK